METIRPISSWLVIAFGVFVFAVALWFGPRRLRVQDETKRRALVTSRRSLLLLSGGLAGMQLADASGVRGTVLGEWGSMVGLCAVLVGLGHGLVNWLRDRTGR